MTLHLLPARGLKVAEGGTALPEGGIVDFLLWIIAVILVIWGIVTLINGGILLGLVLIVVGLLIGPGGVSLVSRRR